MSHHKTNKIRLVHILTSPLSLVFLRGQAEYMVEHGIEFHCVVSGMPNEEWEDMKCCTYHIVPFRRNISPVQDVLILIRLIILLRRLKPDIVHAGTPKAGLLGMIAAYIARVPCLIYHVRGLTFITVHGFKKNILKLVERIPCKIADVVLCDGNSLKHIMETEKICSPERILILHKGSCNGVNATKRFNPARFGKDTAEKTKAELKLPANAKIIGFVGRIARDKGVVELWEAWKQLKTHYHNLYLVFVGDFDNRDIIPSQVRKEIETDDRVRVTGWVSDTAPYYTIMELLVLPAYREGFPNVPLEASAMCLPVITTNVVGCVDAVVDNVTGIIVPIYDSIALKEAIMRYLENPELRKQHGSAGRERVLRDFNPEAIWSALYNEYCKLIALYQKKRTRKKTYLFFKRLFDIAGALLGIILFTPIMLLLSLLIMLKLGKPIFFVQKRPGLNGKPFKIIKFRTMADKYDSYGNLLPDKQRITPLGKWLRKTSMDELPELFNVLKGEMSLVGPRPLLMEYLDRYTPEQARRHEIKPGITGWAQINGRNAISWEEKFKFDVWYVDNANIWLDWKILILTLIMVIKGKGISANGHITMPPFMGSNPQKEGNS